MQPTDPIFARFCPTLWRGKVMARALFPPSSSPRCSRRWLQPSASLTITATCTCQLLTGLPGGQYHALAMRLSERARREHGTLMVISTAGSIENVSRLASNSGRCSDMFALIQDRRTRCQSEAGLELLARLPTPESLLVLGRAGHAFHALPDFRGASIGIGPQGSGTAHLMQQLSGGHPTCGSWISICPTTS